MTTLEECDLRITLPEGVLGRKFDDDACHGMSHCMKAVDFIVELEDRTLFIELKDPDNPDARKQDSGKFVKKFLSGNLDTDLRTKYRDSWLYEWAQGRATKPTYYLVLIAAKTLSAAELLARTESLKRNIPTHGPSGNSWKRTFVTGCAVLNIDAWNSTFPDFPASRIRE